MKKKDISNVNEIFTVEMKEKIPLPHFVSGIQAGFPSPADDYIDKKLDLNDLLVKHPASTFYVRVSGESMRDAGILSGDLLVVDRAVMPKPNHIILAVIQGEFTVKRYVIKNGVSYLVPENEDYPVIKIEEYMDFQVWGVVTSLIREIA